MFSERRRAQSGLVLACIMMFATLAILFHGSRHPSRVGQEAGVNRAVNVVMNGPANVKWAALGK